MGRGEEKEMKRKEVNGNRKDDWCVGTKRIGGSMLVRSNSYSGAVLA